MATVDPTAPEIVALAREALLEVAEESTVGAPVGSTDEGDGVVSLLFANRMPGYPGWRWTVSIAQVDGDEPTVLEVELMPGDGSLVAPEWVPWSERLAEYRAGQDEDGAESDDDDDDESDDDEDADYADEDDDESDDDDDEDEFDADEDDLDEPDDDDLDGVDVDGLGEDESDDEDAAVSDDEDADEPDDEDAAVSDDDQDDEPAAPAARSRGSRRRAQRVRPVDPDDDLELDRLDASEVDPDHHRS